MISVRGRDGLGNLRLSGDIFEPIKVRFVCIGCGILGSDSATRTSEFGRATNILGVKPSGINGGDPPVLNEKGVQSDKCGLKCHCTCL